MGLSNKEKTALVAAIAAVVGRKRLISELGGRLEQQIAIYQQKTDNEERPTVPSLEEHLSERKRDFFFLARITARHCWMLWHTPVCTALMRSRSSNN